MDLEEIIKQKEVQLRIDEGVLEELKRISSNPAVKINTGRRRRYHSRLPNGYLDEPIKEYFNKIGSTIAYNYDIHNYLKSKGYDIRRKTADSWLGRMAQKGILMKVRPGVYRASPNFEWKETTG